MQQNARKEHVTKTLSVSYATNEVHPTCSPSAGPRFLHRTHCFSGAVEAVKTHKNLSGSPEVGGERALPQRRIIFRRSAAVSWPHATNARETTSKKYTTAPREQ